MNRPIIEMDVHGMLAEEAAAKIERTVLSAGSSTYRIRVIHGYNRGNRIEQAIYRELGHGLVPKILRIEKGANPGITELVLREY